MSKQNSGIISKLFNTEIPDLPSRWGKLERLFLIGFIVTFTVLFARTYPGMFLGFGLGDEFEFGLIFSFFDRLKAQNEILFYSAVALLVFNIGFRMQVFLRGQLAYGTNHPDLPMKTIVLFMTANSLNIVFVIMTVSIIGIASYFMGYGFSDGFNAVANLFHLALNIAESAPTIVELPWIAAFFVTYIVQGFFHYWIHRICHLNRFLWLVLHRFHHMPPVLTSSTTNVVVTSIPFFIGMLFVKTLIFATLSKLFFERSLLMEIFFLHTIMWISEAYAHQTALFKEGLSKRWIRYLSFFSTTGVYHYLHHSRDKEIVESNKTNQVNIGGGLFFCWDILFGTYKSLPDESKEAPKVGLWNNPDLHHNPLRLVLSGLLQIGYELIHNKGIKAKLMCLFGSVEYVPEHTKQFHISEVVKQN